MFKAVNDNGCDKDGTSGANNILANNILKVINILIEGCRFKEKECRKYPIVSYEYCMYRGQLSTFLHH